MALLATPDWLSALLAVFLLDLKKIIVQVDRKMAHRRLLESFKEQIDDVGNIWILFFPWENRYGGQFYF